MRDPVKPAFQRSADLDLQYSKQDISYIVKHGKGNI